MNHSTPSTDRPHPSAPGTLSEQLQAVELYVQNPWQCDDREARWQMARRTIMQHARRPHCRLCGCTIRGMHYGSCSSLVRGQQ